MLALSTLQPDATNALTVKLADAPAAIMEFENAHATAKRLAIANILNFFALILVPQNYNLI
jgi:hypothetical protein